MDGSSYSLVCTWLLISSADYVFGKARFGPSKEDNLTESVQLIECPRDAWQGLPEQIPTEYKAEYLKELVLAGFRHIDAVSFVSPKHVRQMSDSEDVMAKLNASLPAG